MLQTIGSINYTLSVLAHWQDEPDIQNTYPYCITDPAERTSEIMETEKKIETNGIREERARRKKRAACSTGAPISEHGSRKSGATLPERGDTSGSAPVESNEALVYRTTTIQILNQIHSADALRKIYTITKRLKERVGC